ncbi:MAG: hypothetical protein C0593_00060 [Marinilabiliales bacterium]|nr:MAG: hypothetical protein C0593_00060 [Marinilabiliales bacterium]
MDNKTKYIKELSALVENKPTAKQKLWLVFLLVLIGAGAFAFFYQLRNGQIVTGMRDNVVWGIYTIFFVVFLGFSYAGALIASILHLARVRWAKPIVRILELIAVFSLIVGPPFILFCLGRFDRLLMIFTHGRLQSPIIWDVIAIVSDLIISIVFIFITFIKDFALLRDNTELKIPKWRRKFYTFFAFNYKCTLKQEELLNKAHDILAAILIPITIVAYSLLACIFAMTLKTGWHSTIFAPYFVLTAVFSGTALVIIVLWIVRKVYKLHDYITKKHFNLLGFTMLVLCLIYGYFTFSEYFTNWYGGDLNTMMILSKLLSFHEYGWMMLTYILLASVIPIVIIGLPWFRNVSTITFAAFTTLTGLILHRFIVIIPTQETPFLPVQDIRPEYISYSATWVEWMLTLGGVAAFLFLFSAATKIVPVISISEMQESLKKKKLKIFGTQPDE